MRSLDPLLLHFGSIFNRIEVRHKDENNDISISLKFLCIYGPIKSFLSNAQEANLNKPIQMTLPRMSFEFTNLSYDSSRKSLEQHRSSIRLLMVRK